MTPSGDWAACAAHPQAVTAQQLAGDVLRAAAAVDDQAALTAAGELSQHADSTEEMTRQLCMLERQSSRISWETVCEQARQLTRDSTRAAIVVESARSTQILDSPTELRQLVEQMTRPLSAALTGVAGNYSYDLTATA